MVVAPPGHGDLNILGSLSAFESIEETPCIGTSFPDKTVQLSSFVTAANSDELIKDLATLVAHRGVVFFRDQDLEIEQQKELAQRMGRLSGKPEGSTLHRHPISEDTPELGANVSVISSLGGISRVSRIAANEIRRASEGWHADITFELVPSDYAILKMHTLPPTGGDTLWASGYEAYDRLSPAFQKFLEGLTAVHDAMYFVRHADANGLKIQDPRGSPENTGRELFAVHPVIRTNPVTGFKTIFVNREFTKRIVELGPDESDDILNYLFRHIADNHDLQVRYKWKKNDIAIWDNRVAFHTATNDYEGHRQGNRVVSIGEKPFFDPKSRSRREALGL